jgi:hypothetical protein
MGLIPKKMAFGAGHREANHPVKRCWRLKWKALQVGLTARDKNGTIDLFLWALGSVLVVADLRAMQ